MSRMYRVLLACVVGITGAAAGSCGSSSQSVTSPSTVKCTVNVSATPTSFSAAGGPGTLTVSTNRECQWDAATPSGWIALGESATRQGPGSVGFTVAANADPATRKGAITVTDQQVGNT